MTKAALEAAVNALLAPAQPITANGMHKPSMQQVIDEMYDAQSRGDVLATVAAALTLATGDQIFIIRSGAAKLVPTTLFSGMKFRADYDASVDAYPANTLGSGVAGAILRGDVFPVTVAGDLDINGIGVTTIYPGALLIALTNTPGTTPANWKVIQ